MNLKIINSINILITIRVHYPQILYLKSTHNNRNHTIFRLDTHLNLTYLCAVTFNNNDYGKRKSKLPGGI